MERLVAQLKALPPWQRYAILILIPLALILYLWFMMVTPALDERSKLEMDVRNLKADIERIKAGIDPKIMEGLKRQEEDLRAEYSKKYEELINLVGEIPTEKDMGIVLRNIGNIARKSGVLILGMQVTKPEKVEYYLAQDAEKKLVKEVPKPKEGQQAQQQAQQPAQQQPAQQPVQQPQQKVESVAFLRSELKLSLTGDYRGVRNFLEGLRKEGIISYPSSLNLINEGNRVRTEINLYLLIKEGKEL
ncbi:MAG: hypothetical protein WHS43_07440 [Aquificaceae bacterium]|jgi:Tfp pilus assembly protein PilO|uniref:hypothetical protein n=1 Tax=Hydrogenobacter sp. Uz 6-8 TaxID=3384828 RepID=UPI00309EC43D